MDQAKLTKNIRQTTIKNERNGCLRTGSRGRILVDREEGEPNDSRVRKAAKNKN